MEKKDFYPLVFEPIFKNYIWGGDSLKDIYNKKSLDKTAESWEIVDRQEEQSVVFNGPLKGISLNKLITKYPKQILGDHKFKRFPLLIKLIDAKDDLSLQVHPSCKTAHLTKGEEKNEAWYILQASDDAAIYAGFNNIVNEDLFRAALKDNTVADLLKKFQVKKKDYIYIPGGCIHAILKGCVILEVQQNSDTTYRVYDWDRVDQNGNKRTLHIDKALTSIDWDNISSPLQNETLVTSNDNMKVYEGIDSFYFTIKKINAFSSFSLDYDENSFHVLFVEEGVVDLECNGYSLNLKKGMTILIPAVCSRVLVHINSNFVSLIEISL
jgi:mannose-6-phosphate isomerase